MRIAVINETSAGDKNKEIMAALEGFQHEVINAGMKERGAAPELTYIHTGLLGAILLNVDRVDFVIGGCGTGQGFLNAIMQYPNVFCGHITNALDAWLFTQINGGNAISLALNQGYGWAGDVNLRFIFERLFSVESGCGYPSHRAESQAESRERLAKISKTAHAPLAVIIRGLDEAILRPVLEYPGVKELLDIDTIEDVAVKEAFRERLSK
jgi:ribose 5-phosphate isomerase RpiB